MGQPARIQLCCPNVGNRGVIGIEKFSIDLLEILSFHLLTLSNIQNIFNLSILNGY